MTEGDFARPFAHPDCSKEVVIDMAIRVKPKHTCLPVHKSHSMAA